MAFFAGQMIGSLLIIYLLSVLVEWLIVKRVMDNPRMGAVVSVAIATVLSVVLLGFGNENGDDWNPGSSGLAAVAMGSIIAVVRFLTAKEVEEDHEELRRTFE